jgi:hypothetical protein
MPTKLRVEVAELIGDMRAMERRLNACIDATSEKTYRCIRAMFIGWTLANIAAYAAGLWFFAKVLGH